MNFKKFIAILIVSICIYSPVHCMDIAKNLVTNEVIPAATIVATGATLSLASDYLFCAADRWYRPNTQFASPKINIKESLFEGVILSLPMVGLARFGFSTPYPQMNIPKLAFVGGSIFAVLSGFDIVEYKKADARVMPNSTEVVTEQARTFIESKSHPIRESRQFTKTISILALGLMYKLFAQSN